MAAFHRLPIICEVCGVELSGGLDTFGRVGQERCFRDQFETGNDSLASAFERLDYGAMFWIDEDIRGKRIAFAELVDELEELEDDPDSPDSEIDELSVKIEQAEQEINALVEEKASIPEYYEQALYWDCWWREHAIARTV